MNNNYNPVYYSKLSNMKDLGSTSSSSKRKNKYV